MEDEDVGKNFKECMKMAACEVGYLLQNIPEEVFTIALTKFADYEDC